MKKFRKFKLSFEQECYDENGVLVKTEPACSVDTDALETEFKNDISDNYIIRNYLDQLTNKIKMELITRRK